MTQSAVSGRSLELVEAAELYRMPIRGSDLYLAAGELPTDRPMTYSFNQPIQRRGPKRKSQHPAFLPSYLRASQASSFSSSSSSLTRRSNQTEDRTLDNASARPYYCQESAEPTWTWLRSPLDDISPRIHPQSPRIRAFQRGESQTELPSNSGSGDISAPSDVTHYIPWTDWTFGEWQMPNEMAFLDERDVS